MMIENLEQLEQSLYQVKAMLKEPDHDIFDVVKARALEKVKLEQAKMNPKKVGSATFVNTEVAAEN